jgi:predicted O-methyltransferase YrrM
VTDYPNWFEFVRPNFEEFLTPLAGKFGLHFLQLGAYTGDASVWLCKNILTGDQSRLLDVDTWEGSDEEAHKSMDFDDVLRVYDQKTTGMPINFFRKTTLDFLVSALTRKISKFDFIYIDADHTTVGVLVDAELAWPLLKSGGIMAFDDYTWGHDSGDPRLAPQVGIDLFLHRHELDYQLLTKNSQVWIRKK